LSFPIKLHAAADNAAPPFGKGEEKKMVTAKTNHLGALVAAAGALVAVGLLVLMLVPAGPAIAAPVSFAPAHNYAAGNSPGAVATANLDSKKGPDLAIVNFKSKNVSVLLNKGDGTFEAAVNYAVPDPSDITAADLDSDGDADLAVANVGTDNVSVLLNDGAGAFAHAPQNFATGHQPLSIAVADFNGDGKSDLAVANQGPNIGNANVVVLINASIASAVDFAAPQNVVVTGMIGDVTAANVDGDTRPDLVVAVPHIPNAPDEVSVLLNTSTGTTVGFAPARNYAVGELPQGPIAADFDGKNGPDLATVNFNSSDVTVLLNKGDGTFVAAAVSSQVGVGSRPGAAADYDGDGKIDLAIGKQDNDSIAILPGNGDGTFGQMATFSAGNAPLKVTSANFDGKDGPDLAAPNRDSNNVSVLGNTTASAPSTPNTAAPKITSLRPAPNSRISNRKPLITAVVKDAETDLKQGDIKLTVDRGVKSFSYNAATDRLTYRSSRLAYGRHTVKVIATDASGLKGKKTWSFKVVKR
jgi:hypothetical protein